ncbi:MAG: putative serine/threonine protein kinase [Ilumatobacteraceae bacterium]|nr:putative serine/threonine protein kinase [Ilumatobacteraceae bacterium]
MATNPSLIGQLVAGRYRVQQRRGMGAHGIVLDAYDEQEDRPVAVKILLPQFANDTASEARFRLEAQVAASFSHPNLNAVYDWGIEAIEGVRVPYLVLERLNGGSLRDMVDRGRLLTPSQALMIGLDVCRGLDAMHRQGVIHRDLRPANLAFGEDRHAQILDVGLSRYVAETTWADPTAAGIDAARYASPEQARGATVANGTLTSATDVYSLALVLVEAVTGQVPFLSDSTVATLNARIDKLLPVSADFGPLASVLSRAGSSDPAARYTAAEFGRALVAAAGKLPRPAPLDVVGSGLFGDTTGGMRRPVTTPSDVAPKGSVDPSPVPDAVAAPVDATLVEVPVAATAVLLGSAAPVAAASPTTAAPSTDAPVVARFDPQTGEPIAAAPVLVPIVEATPVPDLLADPVAPSFVPAESLTTPTPATRPFDFSVDDADVAPPPAPPAGTASPPPRRRRTGLWVLVAVIVVALLGAGAFVVDGLVKGTSHTVPELAGSTEAVARNQIAEDGWTVVVTNERDDQQAAGNVIRTDPGAGTKLDEGKTITLVVSDGATLSTLPDVTGQTLDAAKALLATAHLGITVGQETYDEQVPAGAIISWSVPAQPGLSTGAQVMQSTVIEVVVSQGPAPRTVPKLIGLDEPGAVAALTNLQLVEARAADIYSDDQPVGMVADQSLPAGSKIERGQTVTIAISMGPHLVAMPPLAGLSYADIQAALTAAGLQVGKVDGDKDAGTIQDATLDGTSVTPGQMIHVDTKIDLHFSVPPPPTTAAPETTVPVSSTPP